ncbi:Fc.00g010420.m01.CDS01 [Cosmosporella sp. VM-42]
MSNYRVIPNFEDLPLREGDPPYSAWGLWKDPSLGALNHLTDDLVLRTVKEEIQCGVRVGLNLPLDFIHPSFLGRCDFKRVMHNKTPRIINDDIVTFNTQGSSQWDSFRHFAYQKEAKFYNGVTQENIHCSPDSGVNGIDAWASRGIAGRGVLIDYDTWSRRSGVEYDRLGTHPITLREVKTIAEESKISFRTGDILIIRTGFVEAYSQLTREEKTAYATNHEFPGLAQSREVAEWLWQNQFAAVAADNPAFECTPPSIPDFGMLHPILLSGWGVTIGELFDLRDLSRTCEKLGRWAFFVSSSPLVYTGAVASPPNIQAIF